MRVEEPLLDDHRHLRVSFPPLDQLHSEILDQPIVSKYLLDAVHHASSSETSNVSSMAMHPRTLMAAGHRTRYVPIASRASAVFPAGAFNVYSTRIRVIRSTPSTSSMSPSTSAR